MGNYRREEGKITVIRGGGSAAGTRARPASGEKNPAISTKVFSNVEKMVTPSPFNRPELLFLCAVYDRWVLL
jgi:hypothetical protein